MTLGPLAITPHPTAFFTMSLENSTTQPRQAAAEKSAFRDSNLEQSNTASDSNFDVFRNERTFGNASATGQDRAATSVVQREEAMFGNGFSFEHASDPFKGNDGTQLVRKGVDTTPAIRGIETRGGGATPNESAPTPNDSAPPKPGDAPKAATGNERVVTLRANLSDGGDFGPGSGFPIDLDGGVKDARDGTRHFATAYHVVGDYLGQLNHLPNDIKYGRLDTDGDGSASREELQTYINNHRNNRPRSEIVRPQAQHVLENFDEIAKVSKELDPSATGVSEAGLKEYYHRNHRLQVETEHGTFPAKVVAADDPDDVAIIRIDNLTPEQEAAFGDNFPLARQPHKVGDDVESVGRVKGNLVESERKVTEEKTAGYRNSDGPRFFKSSKPLIGGVSGGPTTRLNPETGLKEVVGINHGDKGQHAPVANLFKLINQLKIERRP